MKALTNQFRNLSRINSVFNPNSRMTISKRYSLRAINKTIVLEGDARECFFDELMGFEEKVKTTTVDVVDFDAVYNRGLINLSWEVNNELQNKSFRIERSIDGCVWESIAMIPSEGTHSNYTIYQYNYKSNKAGVKEYYRLLNEDQDGVIMILARDYVDIPHNTHVNGEFVPLIAS